MLSLVSGQGLHRYRAANYCYLLASEWVNTSDALIVHQALSLSD
jgi:hypothetical protein